MISDRLQSILLFPAICWVGMARAEVATKERFFDERIAPILSKHCLECHDTGTRKGKLDLSFRETAMGKLKRGHAIVPGDAEESLVWQEIEHDDMPEDRPPLSAEEKADLKKWIEDGAVWSSDELDAMAHTRDPRAASDWVRRLTNREYVATILAVTGVDVTEEAARLLPPEVRADGFTNTAYSLTIDMSHVVAYAQLAEMVVGKMDVMAFAKKHAGNVDEQSLGTVVEGMGKWVFRRPLGVEEKGSFLKVAEAVKKEGGDAGEVLAYVVEAMLQSPGFLYRLETPAETNEAYLMASRLSYAIWGAPPDAGLMALADSGEILKPEVIGREARRMLRDAWAIERSLEFAEQWLNLGRVKNLRPDPQHFPNWTAGLADDMREETLGFFREIVWKQKRPLADLLNADVTVVSPRLAAHYDLPRQPRVSDRKGLVALYEFAENKGEVVRDTSGNSHHLRIMEPSRVEWAEGRLRIKESTLIRSEKPFLRGTEALRKSGELSVEVWIENERKDQKALARIVSLSGGTSDRNFTLGQEGGRFDARVRIPKRGNNGLPAFESPEGIATTKLTHLVFTRDKAGEGRFYLDGEFISASTDAGDFSSWDDSFHFLLGNETSGDRPWLGTYHQVSVYDRALDAGEIFGNAGGRRVYDLKDVPERGGLLTQASLLTIGGDEASMVTRGLFVLHDLLHSAVGSAPPGVDTTPQPTKAGVSQRMMSEKRINDSSCKGCHTKFEPLAFGLERYDGIGAYSRKDRHGNALRSDGEILFTGVREAMPYAEPAELMDLLAGSGRVHRNFTRKLLQFTLGRPLTGSDNRAIQKIHEESTAGGGTYESLMTAIVTSDMFRKIETRKKP